MSRSKEAIFKGGFAGKCENDQVWQKTQDSGNTWRCSGEIPWTQTVYLPEFQNNDNAGLIFPPYNFMNSKADLPDYINEQQNLQQVGAGYKSFDVAAEQMSFIFTDSDPEIDHIDARCWEGTSSIDVDNPPSDVEVTDWFEIDVPSNPSDPVGGFRSLNHGGSYSCFWEITTTGGITNDDGFETKMVEIHKHLGSNPSNKDKIAVKNMTEDSSYASDLPDMTGSDHEWTASELTDKISSWN